MVRKKRTGRKLYFLYENSGDANDAVTIAMQQLVEGLSLRGFNCEILQPKTRRQSSASKIRKSLSQCRFFLNVLMALLSRTNERCVVVTMDAPSGLRLLTESVSRISRGKMVHVPWVMDLYRFVGPPTPAWTLSRFQRTVEQVALRKSKNTVVLGQCMARVATEHFHIKPAVIPIWQDASKFAKPTPGRLLDFRTSHNLLGKFVVLYSGTARSLHPLGGMVEAARSLQSYPNIAFQVIGRGSEVDRIRTEVASIGLSNFRVLDYLPAHDVAVAAHTADVHVVALADNATGTCVPSKGYAAMAAGKPVLYLGAPAGQLAEDILRGDAGAVFAEASTPQVAHYLLGLATNSSRLRQQGSNAKSFFEAHRTSAIGVEAWVAHLQTL